MPDSINIVALETQNNGEDWPLIVSAVPCATCSAAPGEVCRALSSFGSPMIKTGQQRIDWHAQRKYEAAVAWYARKGSESDAKEEQQEKGIDIATADPTKHPRKKRIARDPAS